MLNIQIRNSIKDVSMLKGDSGQKILRVAIDVGVRFTDVNKNQKAQDDANATGEDDLKVEILGLFIADYLIVRDDIAGNVLEEFAKSDALFAVWPYWREFVNSACLRARLPALVLPLPAIGEQPSNSPN